MKFRLTDDPRFKEFTSSQLSAVYYYIGLQIDELLNHQWELNQEQTRILMRIHKLDAQEEEVE